MKRTTFVMMLWLLLCLCLPGMAEDAPGGDDTFFPVEAMEKLESFDLDMENIVQYDDVADHFFVLVRTDDGENRLYAFRLQDEEWKYWMYTAKAVPQGNGVFMILSAGGGQDLITGETFTKPTLTLSQMNETEEYATVSYQYQLENKVWKLIRVYWNEENCDNSVIVSEDKLTYYNNEFEKIGAAYGDFQRDLRYISSSTLPQTYREAENKLSFAPDMPYSAQLRPTEVNFTGGRRYPVYAAPDEFSYRAANGRAVVSTNSWIQVFGRTGNWILIQYAIDDDQYRFGYISADALPGSAQIPALQLDHLAAYLTQPCTLTDDPLHSGTGILSLPAGSPVTWLATMGNFAYVESNTGVPVRGFVPVNALSSDYTFYLENHPDVTGQRNPLRGVLSVSGKGQVTLTVTGANCTANGQPVQAFALYSLADGQKILTANRNVSGTFPGTATFCGDGRGFLLVPVDAQGREDRTRAISLQR